VWALAVNALLLCCFGVLLLQFATMMARKLQEATSSEKLIESFQV